ncbi:hypothetical protein FAES_4061 [Fibrella aestuarina BUZ 2]|uniref:Uncharacterized protein n=1 Tax=Fibrella aestuarina BUZ 2 TaxID=1166018 RepID=I0KD58_9BACT|nr:hypothetical protein [Fibrella aestuarina]CCH02061.1 hypothetical protein FAES_4061 [Fibrella aestuarina BUZ 2]
MLTASNLSSLFTAGTIEADRDLTVLTTLVDLIEAERLRCLPHMRPGLTHSFMAQTADDLYQAVSLQYAATAAAANEAPMTITIAQLVASLGRLRGRKLVNFDDLDLDAIWLNISLPKQIDEALHPQTTPEPCPYCGSTIGLVSEGHTGWAYCGNCGGV